ncbi:MAG: PD40 domain-containing protein [Anaerolineae bacterium]|nr:PD40 domain-containing protein [Anaerolineae bacterium]
MWNDHVNKAACGVLTLTLTLGWMIVVAWMITAGQGPEVLWVGGFFIVLTILALVMGKLPAAGNTQPPPDSLTKAQKFVHSKPGQVVNVMCSLMLVFGTGSVIGILSCIPMKGLAETIATLPNVLKMTSLGSALSVIGGILLLVIVFIVFSAKGGGFCAVAFEAWIAFHAPVLGGVVGAALESGYIPYGMNRTLGILDESVVLNPGIYIVGLGALVGGLTLTIFETIVRIIEKRAKKSHDLKIAPFENFFSGMFFGAINSIILAVLFQILMGFEVIPTTIQPDPLTQPVSTLTPSPIPSVDYSATLLSRLTATRDPFHSLLITAQPTDREATALAPSPAALTAIPEVDPCPDAPLSDQGPWLVFLATSDREDTTNTSYLWAMNADGSGLTQLDAEPVVSFRIRPYSSAAGGAVIAYLTGTNLKYADQSSYALKLLSLPGGQPREIVELLNPSITLDSEERLYDLSSALQLSNGPAWSSDGSTLAFVGMLNGSSVDVYLYDYIQGKVSRLTDSPTHSYDLSWSPDGRYLLHREFDFLNMFVPSGSGGYQADRVDGAGGHVLTQDNMTRSYGWLNTTEIILSTSDWDTGAAEIYTANIETGETSIILTGTFYRAIFGKEHNVWLLAPHTVDMPLVLYRYGERTELLDHGIVDAFWSAEDEAFLGWSHQGLLYLIAPTGEVTQAPMQFGAPRPESLPTRSISPDGQWWAWHENPWATVPKTLWVGAPMTSPGLCPVAGYTAWSPDSQRLLVLTWNNGLYVLHQPGFQPECSVPDIYAVGERDKWQATWIP